MQAAIFKVFEGDTGGVLPRIHPGAPEADLRQQLVTESIIGRLEDSNGILVTKTSTQTAYGDCRIFADAAGRQMPRQAFALTHSGRGSCGTAGGERQPCCMRHLWHPHPLPALNGLSCWVKQTQH